MPALTSAMVWQPLAEHCMGAPFLKQTALQNLGGQVCFQHLQKPVGKPLGGKTTPFRKTAIIGKCIFEGAIVMKTLYPPEQWVIDWGMLHADVYGLVWHQCCCSLAPLNKTHSCRAHIQELNTCTQQSYAVPWNFKKVCRDVCRSLALIYPA